MVKKRPIKVVLGKLGLDGHDRGIQVIAQGLADAGMEVVYMGLRQSAASLARACLEEDADVLGVSSLSGAHNSLFSELLEEMKKQKLERVMLIAGGVIPEEDVASLKASGFAAVFTPGTAIAEIVKNIQDAKSS
jgi:methylmalonyl-CoA mutase C-terminal domain/subunit